ncbi:MAG TPA: hypothetical protein VGI60_04410 [Chthoniobacterales bacterium]|jgi:hypothetical protein
MNSQCARNSIVSAARVVALLFFHPSLFAQLAVTVKTPGTNFSVAGTKGSADNVAGGRRFRAPASEDLKIRDLLRVPPSPSGVSKTQLLQQLAIHFRTSPSRPSLRSVELLNSSNREFLIPTNLAGDYTARLTSTPKEIANVWKWTVPIKVDSHSVRVSEIQFPGGFEGNSNPGESALTFVDAQFQGKLGPNINDRIPPSAGMPQPESGVGKKASLGVFFPSFRPGSSQG